MMLGVCEVGYEQERIPYCSQVKKGFSWQILAFFQNEAAASGIAADNNSGFKQAEQVLMLSYLMVAQC